MKVIPRYSWGARTPRRSWGDRDDWLGDSYALQTPVKCVVFGYTMTTPCFDEDHCKMCVRDIQERNMSKYQLVDIRYNFLIDNRGRLYACRGWKTMPMLPKKYRAIQRTSLYIGFIGFNNAESRPSPEMFHTKEELLRTGVKIGDVSSKFLEFNI